MREINMKFLVFALILVTSTFIVTPTIVKDSFNFQTYPKTLHSGGTDKCGCHYNRETGEYHCHKRKQRGGDCPD